MEKNLIAIGRAGEANAPQRRGSPFTAICLSLDKTVDHLGPYRNVDDRLFRPIGPEAPGRRRLELALLQADDGLALN